MAIFQVNYNQDNCTRYGAVLDMNSGVTYMGYAGASCSCGWRFKNVTIPKESTILTAVMRYYHYGYTNSSISGYYFGEKNASPLVFSTPEDFDGRVKTVASQIWNDSGEYNHNDPYNSPDISAVVQEIINLPAWASGNNLVIFWFDNSSASYKQPYSFSGYAGYAARLDVTWLEAPKKYPMPCLKRS